MKRLAALLRRLFSDPAADVLILPDDVLIVEREF